MPSKVFSYLLSVTINVLVIFFIEPEDLQNLEYTK